MATRGKPMTIKEVRQIVIAPSKAKQLKMQEAVPKDRLLKDVQRERLAADIAAYLKTGGKVRPLPGPGDDRGAFTKGKRSAIASR